MHVSQTSGNRGDYRFAPRPISLATPHASTIYARFDIISKVFQLYRFMRDEHMLIMFGDMTPSEPAWLLVPKLSAVHTAQKLCNIDLRMIELYPLLYETTGAG